MKINRTWFINFFIAMVWFVNGFFCKILNLAPRHQEIVSRILSENYSAMLTKAIGILEVLMAVWIFTRIKPKLTATLQISAIAIMNILEFWLVPDLLLFGKMNIVFAFTFITVIYFNEFQFKKPQIID